MEKIMHWWMEVNASGRVSMGIHLIREGLGDSEALQWAHWQAVAFRLSLAQHEAFGWWNASPRFSGLCPMDFLFHTDASSPKKCMAYLMTLSSDDIVVVILLKATGEEHRTPSTPEEEAILLHGEIKVSQVPGSHPEWLEIPSFVEPANQSTTHSASSPSLTPQPSCLPSGKVEKPWQGMEAGANSPQSWVSLYLQEHYRVLEWWREFWSLLHSKNKCVSDIQAQGLAVQQATAFRLPATQLKKESSLANPPCLGVLGCRDYLPSKDFKGTQDYWVMQYKEMVALVMALQRCTIHSRTPPGILCKEVQELCRCLASVIKSGNLVDLGMLDVARRDPVAPVFKEGVPSLMPGVEPPVSVPIPSEPTTSEPE